MAKKRVRGMFACKMVGNEEKKLLEWNVRSDLAPNEIYALISTLRGFAQGWMLIMGCDCKCHRYTRAYLKKTYGGAEWWKKVFSKNNGFFDAYNELSKMSYKAQGECKEACKI